MSHPAKVTASSLALKKRRGQKITMLTAYDFPLARMISLSQVDVAMRWAPWVWGAPGPYQ